MNGAERTIDTLLRRGVDTCFTNPGTSEMHFVAALDRTPSMRSVLALFEGVASGAADGYGRIARRPAVTLLHLGPGMANGLANLHNARRARTPVVNVVGEHAVAHQEFDPPLATDIEGLARPMSGWVGTVTSAAGLAATVDAAVDAAVGPPGTVATVIVPADLSWGEVGEAVPGASTTHGAPGEDARGGSAGTGQRADGDTSGAGGTVHSGAVLQFPATSPMGDVVWALRSGEPAAIVVGGRACNGPFLRRAAQVAAASGAQLLAETFPARLARGAGIPAPDRLAYLAELAQLQMAGLRHLVLVDAPTPVSFFAYPGIPSVLVPDGCALHVLAGPGDDLGSALDELAGGLGVAADAVAPAPASARPDRPSGALTAQSVAAAIGAVLPEGAIVSDESNTCGIHIPGATAGCPPHDWLTLTGGAIGQGLPVATGAAIAAPGRRVLCLEADGSAMYTIQSLWTQAREGLDVTTVVLDNHAYGILAFELSRVGAGTPGPIASSMLDLDRPELDFVALATGMGVPACRATSAEELVTVLEKAMAEPGPSLIQVPVPRTL